MEDILGEPELIIWQLESFKEYLNKQDSKHDLLILIDNIEFPFIGAFNNFISDLEFECSNSFKMKKESDYSKILEFLDYFIESILERDFFMKEKFKVFMTGTHCFFKQQKIYKNACSYYSYYKHTEKGFLNKYYAFDYKFAKNLLKEKMNLYEYDKSEKRSVIRKLRGFAFPKYFFKDCFEGNRRSLYFSDFFLLYKKMKKSLDDDSCWFKEGNVMYDLVKLFIESNSDHYIPYLKFIIKKEEFTKVIDETIPLNLIDILELNIESFLRFLVLGGILVIDVNHKIKFINKKIKEEIERMLTDYL